MTSRWSMEAPPRSTEAISPASLAKSADRIEGTISIICGLFRSYHSGVETVPRVAPGNAEHDVQHEFRRHACHHRLVLFRLQRAGGVYQQAARGKGRARVSQQRGLAAGQIFEIGRTEAPLDLGVAAQGSGAGAGRIHQNPVETAAERERPRAI